MDATPGRTCPLRYRYGAAALAKAPEQATNTLYIVGGLYGNLPALAAIEALIARETGPVTLCFNGDFNWFNVDDAGFVAVNRTVFEHDAIQGNVEAEFSTPGDAADCGCAYPDSVDASVVERSNAIHAQLKATARRHPDILARLEALPMVRRYRIGDHAIGVVHGDAESLAGWRFDLTALDDPAQCDWIEHAFVAADVDLFASTHTCLPALRAFGYKAVINNGAAGMPNFVSRQAGLITRIGVTPPPVETLYGTRLDSLHVHAIEAAYDQVAWEQLFLSNWPVGSPAHESYYRRIVFGPDYGTNSAYPIALSGNP